MTKIQERDVRANSEKFFVHLTGQPAVASCRSDCWKEVYHLIETAFRQYKLGWEKKKLSDWAWPYIVVDGDFEGNQPWSVCFREAYRLTKAILAESNSMYAGIKFTREQLVFVVRSILTGALDEVERTLPTQVSWEAHAIIEVDGDDMSPWEHGVVASAGMALSIFAAQLLDDGIGSNEALFEAGDFATRIQNLVYESWKDEGQTVCKKIQNANGSYNVKDVLIGYPDCRLLAEEFVDKLFVNYLK